MTTRLDPWFALTVAAALSAGPLLALMLVVVKPWLRLVLGLDVPDGVTP